MAAAIFVELIEYVVDATDYFWPAELSTWMQEGHALPCWVRRYTIRRLIEPSDDLALHVVQTRMARRRNDFPTPATADELTLLHHDPVSLVRAAYAFAREFSG